MSNILGHYFSDIVKVKAKRYNMEEGRMQADCRKFRLNPQTASYDFLRNLLARMFDITGEFTVSYRTRNKAFVPLNSDWDLDVALSEASDTYLQLKIQLQPMDKALDEWDIICPSEIPSPDIETNRCLQESGGFVSSILNEMEKTVLRVQRALSFECNSKEVKCDKMPMGLTEFENFLDSDGTVVRPREFHMSVYQGGVEPSLRPIVWKHLLNVFPEGMNTKEREHYLRSKSAEYYRLRYGWQHLVHEGDIPEVLQNVTTQVRKDVRRTDRNQKFYSGSDDNKNVRAMFNILTTYAVTHPGVSYCQGMSDILSPILYVMENEAHAYICFCGLLKRAQSNFRHDGRSIKIKFRHLRKMLQYHDRELFLYLKDQDALDLLFCYRWFVLEAKREFAYNDALQMLEVMWGSLPPMAPQKELNLYDVIFPINDSSPKNNDENAFFAKDNLIWIDDHFSLSPVEGSLSRSLSTNGIALSLKKWTIRVRSESKLTNIASTESSTEEEINLPVYYRKRKYRSYIAKKLSKLSDSGISKEIEVHHSSTLNTSNKIEPAPFDFCQSWACGEDFVEEKPFNVDAVHTAREFLRNQWCYSNTINELQLNNWLNGKRFDKTDTQNKDIDLNLEDANSRQRHGSSDSNYSTNSEELSDSECLNKNSCTTRVSNGRNHSRSEGYISDTASSTKEASAAVDDDSDTDSEDNSTDVYDYGILDSMSGNQYEEALSYFRRKKELLPPPHILGDGNPFLMFLCVAMIMQQRDEILRRNLDFNEIGMLFDKLVRKHRLMKVLHKARTMFSDYLNMGWNEDHGDSDDEFDT